jgi:hypothetical protein
MAQAIDMPDTIVVCFQYDMPDNILLQRRSVKYSDKSGMRQKIYLYVLFLNLGALLSNFTSAPRTIQTES